MSELQRLKGLLPPEMQSWVFVEAAAAADPPLISIEEIGRDEVEIQIDLDPWDQLGIEHRNLLCWHEVGRIQNDTVPRDGWEMAALAIGLGGAIGELWVQDGLLLILALGLSGFSGYRLYLKNNSEKRLADAIAAGVAGGPAVGARLREVEDWWIAEGFRPGRKACLDRLRRAVRERPTAT